MKKSRRSWIDFTLRPSLFVIPAITVLVAMLGSAFTTPGLPWYDTLQQPIWTPPDFLFGVAWSVIYFCATISALITWNDTKRDRHFRLIILLFLSAAILASGWSLVFFQWHQMFYAIFVAALLAFSAFALIALLWKRSRFASLLLLPLAAWTTFATLLNYFVWHLNV